MSTVDTSTWNPDPDLNESLEGIPLNEEARISETWQALRILMAAGGLHGLQLVTFEGATAFADGRQGLVPAPEAGDQDKVLKGDGTWGTVEAGDVSVAWEDIEDKPSTFTPSSHAHGNLTNDGKLSTASRAVVTDGSKAVTVSSTTATEVGYLSGLSANVQNQFDARLLASEKITNSDIEAMMEG